MTLLVLPTILEVILGIDFHCGICGQVCLQLALTAARRSEPGPKLTAAIVHFSDAPDTPPQTQRDAGKPKLPPYQLQDITSRRMLNESQSWFRQKPSEAANSTATVEEIVTYAMNEFHKQLIK